jgi:hypothetical protein
MWIVQRGAALGAMAAGLAMVIAGATATAQEGEPSAGTTQPQGESEVPVPRESPGTARDTEAQPGTEADPDTAPAEDRREAQLRDETERSREERSGTPSSPAPKPRGEDPQGEVQAGRSPAQTDGEQGAADAVDAFAIVVRSVPTYEVTPGAIAASPGALYGAMVSVEAEVEDVLSPNAFTLGEDRVGAGPDVVVIAPRALSDVSGGETVRVTGHLRPLVITELDASYEWFDRSLLGGAEKIGEIEVSQRPAVVAASIITSDGRELLGAPTP